MRQACQIIFIGFLLCLPAVGRSQTPGEGLITVTGDADVLVVPDEAVVRLAVDTEDEDLKDAKGDNDKRVGRVLKVVRQLGVEPKHIKTDRMSITIHYQDWQKRKLRSYLVSKNIVVTVKDLDKLERILTDAIEAGANRMFGVEFRSTELRRHKDRARLLAVKAAREKADAMAAALGRKAGKPHTIREEPQGWRGGWWGWGNVVAQNRVQGPGPGEGSLAETTAPGMIRVNAKVTVGFELE